MRVTWIGRIFPIVGCLLVLTGCTPAVQKQSITSITPTQVIDPHVSWTPLLTAAQKSVKATIYEVKSTSNVKNGINKLPYSFIGQIAGNVLTLTVNENNLKLQFYQQGKVAYESQEGGVWTKAKPLAHLNVYAGYQQLITAAAKHKLPLKQMNRVYVFSEYCHVYRTVIPSRLVPKSSVLAAFADGQTGRNNQIQYTFYVSDKNGYLVDVETKSVNDVNQLGPITNTTHTNFRYIQDSNLAASIKVPASLVSQLESATPTRPK